MRRLKRITELERLANQTQLVCPLPYNNLKRNEEIFYSFCREYGDSLGVSITEEKFGYLAWKKIQTRAIIDDLKDNRFPLEFLDLLFTPWDFYNVPIIGMAGRCVSKGNSVKILLSRYPALLDILYFLKDYSSKTHEYMHAYNRIVANDLLKRGVLRSPLSFFCDVEPTYRVPTYEELRNYERQFLAKMIKSEDRWMQKINRS